VNVPSTRTGSQHHIFWAPSLLAVYFPQTLLVCLLPADGTWCTWWYSTTLEVGICNKSKRCRPLRIQLSCYKNDATQLTVNTHWYVIWHAFVQNNLSCASARLQPAISQYSSDRRWCCTVHMCTAQTAPAEEIISLINPTQAAFVAATDHHLAFIICQQGAIHSNTMQFCWVPIW